MMTKHAPNDAEIRIKRCVSVLCIFPAVLGVSLMGLGYAICRHLEEWTNESYPRLWLVGLLPVVFAVFGALSLLHGRRISIISWLLLSCVVAPLCMAFFSMRQFFNTELFWVHLQIYGACVTEHKACRCSWQNSSNDERGVQHSSSCDQIYFLTTTYLIFIGLLILTLVVMVIMVGLGFIMTLCIQYCVPKDGRYSHSTSMATLGNGTTRYDPTSFFRQSSKNTSLMTRNYLTVPTEDRDGISTITERSSNVS